jgi:hypothetical protein
LVIDMGNSGVALAQASGCYEPNQRRVFGIIGPQHPADISSHR